MPRRPLHALAFLLGLWLALAALGPLGFASPGGARRATDPLAETERGVIAAAADAARLAAGAGPLARRAGLDATAEAWTRHLLVAASPRPGVLLRRPPPDQGPRYWNAVSLGPDEPLERAVARWLADPPSRLRLLDPATPAAGVGVASRADGGRLVVQVYSEPILPDAR